MTEEERTFTKQQKFWGHNNRVFQVYQILPLIHEKLKGESTSLPKVTYGAALFQATLQ